MGSRSGKQTRIQPWKCTAVQLSHIFYFTDRSEFAGESDLSYILCSSCCLFLSNSRICQDVRIVLLWYTGCSDSVKLYTDFPKLFHAFSGDQFVCNLIHSSDSYNLIERSFWWRKRWHILTESKIFQLQYCSVYRECSRYSCSISCSFPPLHLVVALAHR